MRKICVVTGTRAEYGLLSGLMRLIRDDKELELQVIATNMHLSPEYGLTYREIEKDGFVVNKKVEMLLSADTYSGTTKSLGLGIIGFADAYADLQPDLLVILGDRYEMLGAASAALLFKIPVAHLAGGDITEGAYDDAIRHAITKMSHLHFTFTEPYRRRVIQLGEAPERVFNTGSTGIDNLRHLRLMSRDELERSIGFGLGDRCLIVTFHPVTLEEQTARQQFEQVLQAVDETGCRLIFTLPNSDCDSRVLIRMIQQYVHTHADKAIAFTSMGYLRYLSALQYAWMVVGNSSSGLLEVPSFGIPTVNIGNRQKGRLRCESVIDCEPTLPDIRRALERASSPAFREIAARVKNPYEQPHTNERIYRILKETPLDGLTSKHFYDWPTP